MDMTQLVVILFLVTAFAVIAFALSSKYKVEKRMEDPNAPKSSLAKDGPDHRNAETTN
ncbi:MULTISPECIES: hypothetical protein [unclassified Dinoroseobacter]|uniref:hypothetical protein n=1 Tax=unclassified Dinoroseobacter TaxID=2620028 RepID=UPI003C79A5A5